MPLIPSPWPVLHTARGISTTTDAHGNQKIVDADPVIRKVMAIFGVGTKGNLSSDQMFSNEYLDQTKDMYHMVIPMADLGFYKSGDKVQIFGTVNGDSYEGGLAFRLDGDPASDLHGPWPRLYKAFGGLVKIVRVN